MKLVKIWEANLEKAYELQMSFPQEETGFCNSAYGYTIEQFAEYVENCRMHSMGLNLKEGFVPDTIFVLVDDNENYVGICNLRHYLNEFLANGPGHIGMGISSKYRRKGYATYIGRILNIRIYRRVICKIIRKIFKCIAFGENHIPFSNGDAQITEAIKNLSRFHIKRVIVVSSNKPRG